MNVVGAAVALVVVVAAVGCEPAPAPGETGLVLDVGGTFGPRSFVDPPNFPERENAGTLTATGELGPGKRLELVGVDDDGTFTARLPNIGGAGVFPVGANRVELSWTGPGGGTAVSGTLRVDDAGPRLLQGTYQVSVDDSGTINASGDISLETIAEDGQGV